MSTASIARLVSRRLPLQYRRMGRDAREHLVLPRSLSSRCLSSIIPRESNLPSKLIDFSISAKIQGEESQIAMVTLRPGETLRAESGSMLFMTQGVILSPVGWQRLQSAQTQSEKE